MQELSVVCPMAQIKQAEAQRVCLGPGHIKKSITARDRTKIAQFLLLSSNHFTGKCKAPDTQQLPHPERLGSSGMNSCQTGGMLKM